MVDQQKMFMNIIVPTILFILLSPGMILTVPPGDNGVLASGQTSITAVVVQAVLFALLYLSLRVVFPSYY